MAGTKTIPHKKNIRAMCLKERGKVRTPGAIGKMLLSKKKEGVPTVTDGGRRQSGVGECFPPPSLKLVIKINGKGKAFVKRRERKFRPEKKFGGPPCSKGGGSP